MKKWIKICLACLMVFTIFPTKDVHAEEFTKKTVTIYNNVDSEKMNLDTYIKNDEVYVQLHDLTKMLGFVVKNDQGKITLSKKGKRVTIKDGSIIYGKSKQDLSVIDQDGVIYVPLTPTINYLDARIKMVENQLILFKPKISFSEMVSDMEDTINQGYLLIGKDDGWSTGVSWAWLLINGESSSYVKSERLEQVVLSLLVEDDVQELELSNSKLASLLIESNGVLESLKNIEDLNLDFYDDQFAGLIDKFGTAFDIGEGYIDAQNYANMISNFYFNNINNAQATILNDKSKLYNFRDYVYYLFKKYVKYYNDNRSDNAEVYNYIVRNQLHKAPDLILTEVIAGSNPVWSAGLSGLRIYSELLNLNDQASVILSKQDYNSIQCKILNKIIVYQNKIKKGHVLSNEEINDYTHLVRMYYHISSVYYKSMTKVDQKAFEGNYKAAKAIVDDIDRVPYTLYSIDDPMEHPSTITKEQVENAIQTDDWSTALKDLIINKDFEMLWDIFNSSQSRLHLEDMDFDDIPEVIITNEDYRGSFKSSSVYKYEDGKYKSDFGFHGRLLGSFITDNEKFFRIATLISGAESKAFIIIQDTGNKLKLSKDGAMNEYYLNGNKITQKEFEDLDNKYSSEKEKISSLNAAIPFYNCFSKVHKEELLEFIINTYNEGKKNTDYSKLYQDFDYKLAFIAILDKNGLHTSVPFSNYKLILSDETGELYEVTNDEEKTKTTYEVHKNLSDGGIDFVLDIKPHIEIKKNLD